MKDLHVKAIEATKKHCERRGYEIIDTCWQAPDGAQADIIADDHGTVCFINVVATESIFNGFSENCLSRKEWEHVALSWLSQSNRKGDFPVRFDNCKLAVINPGQAFIRYHVNALGAG